MNFDLQKSFEILERSPKVYRTLLEGLSQDWVEINEGKDTWSAYDILGHLIHGERTDWMQRVEIILSSGPNKTFSPFDRFAQFGESRGKSLLNLLDEFEQARKENMLALRGKNLTEDDFLKTGIHPSFGVVTLKHLLSTWTIHDLAHLNQVSRVMMKQYKNEIGPWKEYFSLLKNI